MTSESDSAGENNPAPHADNKSDHNSAEADPVVPPAPRTAEPETEPSTECDSRPYDKQKHWLDYLGAGMAGIGLIVLIIYTIFTGLMYCANKKAADAAKSAADTAASTMRIDQRAWIHVGGDKDRYILTVGQPIYVPIVIGDTGKTPAKNVTGRMKAELLKPGEAPNFIYSGQPHYDMRPVLLIQSTDTHITLAVARAIPGTTKAEPVLYDARTKKQFESGNLILVYHGRLTYEDVFGISHWLQFCSSGTATLGKGSSNKCNEYNKMDDN